MAGGPAVTWQGEWALPPLTGSCAPQTTYKGKSSFQTYSDYLRWESFLQQQLQTFPEGSALRRGFQTCEHWKQIFMEIIGKRQPSPPLPRVPRPGGAGAGRVGGEVARVVPAFLARACPGGPRVGPRTAQGAGQLL